MNRIREAIGSQAWLSLYQQRPTAEEGAIFRRAWLRTYQTPPEFHKLIFSLDTAFKTTESADFSVIEVWAQSQTGYYLLHVWRQRAEFPELKRQAVALADIWRPHAVLIEDAASGQSLIQALKAETRLPILGVKPMGDKTARASAVSPLLESGRVYLPETAEWLRDFVDELIAFPAGPHDDAVDSLTQALNYLRGAGYQPMEYTPCAVARWSPTFDEGPGASRLYGRAEDFYRERDRTSLGGLIKSRRFGGRGAF